jgi:hypothetical protein
MIATLFLLLQTETHATQPGYFNAVAFSLLAAGLVTWLIASVLGFGRARKLGPAARWFARSAVCLLFYHLHLFLIGVVGVMAFRRGQTDYGMMLSVGAFFNLFIVLGALCAIMGFINLKPAAPAKLEEDSD